MPAVRSTCEPGSVLRARILVRTPDRIPRGRGHARTGRRPKLAGRADDEPLGLGPCGRVARTAALRAPALSLRRSRGLLAYSRDAHVFRRTADPVHRQPRGHRFGDRVPARKPEGRSPGRHRLGNRSRMHRDRRRRTSPVRSPASDLIFIPLRFVVAWVAGYALRERSEQAEAAEMRATLAERDREAAQMRATLAEREREAAARRGGRGARADRARAPRHRRPRNERDGPPGRSRPTRAATNPRGGQGSARARRASRAYRSRRDAPPARRDAQRRRRRRARSAAGPRCARFAA